MQDITARHNNIVARLLKASLGYWSVLKQNQPLLGSSKRPDLVLTHNTENAALIIDVACTFEDGPAAFDKIRLKKTQKYAEIAKKLRASYEDVSVEAVVVGALESWDPKNNRICHRLCSKKYTNLMRKLIVSDTLRFSKDIYSSHISGSDSSQPPRFRQFLPAISSVAPSALPASGLAVAVSSSPHDLNFNIELCTNNEPSSAPTILTHQSGLARTEAPGITALANSILNLMNAYTPATSPVLRDSSTPETTSLSVL